MARLVLTAPHKKEVSFPLRKKLVTIGAAATCDVVIDGNGVGPVHAHLLREAGGFTISTLGPSAKMEINGQATHRQTLKVGDVIAVGGCTLTLEDDPVVTEEAAPQSLTAASIFPQLVEFSERLAADVTPETLFRTLLDQVIALTGANKGFLVLVNGDGDARIPVARNISQADLNEGPEALSDSILSSAMDTGEAVIVSDATQDARFRESLSVVDLKLNSVMCAPLRFQGRLLGALYLGNDRVASLFTEPDLEALRIYASQAALILHNASLVNHLREDNANLRDELEQAGLGRIIGQSDVMKAIFKTIDRLADTDISVMIQGETGTGKELIARELHHRSSRREAPFISLNCGAIPEHLLESELFGHVKGAFTGAITHRIGRFEAADGGTLLLDEIGEMPLSLQVKLLRVLQQRTIERVGEGRERPIDIRVISATNKDLEKMVAEGSFREDLYYRLNEVMIKVPPLRDRGEDVILLARYYLDRFLSRYESSKVKGFSKAALGAMRRYVWPGNVRQLENRIKKAVILSDRPMLAADDLEIRLDRQTMKILPLKEAQDQFSLNYVHEVLEANNWNKSQTARDLDVDPRTIFRYAERLSENEAS